MLRGEYWILASAEVCRPCVELASSFGFQTCKAARPISLTLASERRVLEQRAKASTTSAHSKQNLYNRLGVAKTTKILLIRHAYTGVKEKLQGPQTPISTEGKLQAKKLALRLTITEKKIHIFYTSTYKRAIETANIISAEFANSKIKKTPNLNEIGVWTSPTQLHSPKISPQKYEEELGILHRAQDMAIQFLKSVSFEHVGEAVGVVTHGNIIRGIISQSLGAGVETVVRLKVNNASLSILEYDQASEFFRLSLFNDISHLE